MKYAASDDDLCIGTEAPVTIREGIYREERSNDRLRIILITVGAGIIETGAGPSPFTAPTLCFLNGSETARMQTSEECFVFELSFLPVFLRPDHRQPCFKTESCMESIPCDAALLNAFTKRSPNYNGIVNISTGISLHIETILRQIKKELKDRMDCRQPYRIKSLLLELIFMTSRIYERPLTDKTFIMTERYRKIHEIVIYLMNNCQEKIQLGQLTEKFNINRTSLNEYFKAATGLTVMNYFLHLKIHMAMAMLKDTSLEISEIMFRSGFINNSHFLRAFKRIAGVSPAKYRKIHTCSGPAIPAPE